MNKNTNATLKHTVIHDFIMNTASTKTDNPKQPSVTAMIPRTQDRTPHGGKEKSGGYLDCGASPCNEMSHIDSSHGTCNVNERDGMSSITSSNSSRKADMKRFDRSIHAVDIRTKEQRCTILDNTNNDASTKPMMCNTRYFIDMNTNEDSNNKMNERSICSKKINIETIEPQLHALKYYHFRSNDDDHRSDFDYTLRGELNSAFLVPTTPTLEAMDCSTPDDPSRLILSHDKRFKRTALVRKITEEEEGRIKGPLRKKGRMMDSSSSSLETYHHKSGWQYLWACEKCRERKCGSYEEACEHESRCKGLEIMTWKCEKCRVASFQSFAECVDHENSCFLRK